MANRRLHVRAFAVLVIGIACVTSPVAGQSPALIAVSDPDIRFPQEFTNITSVRELSDGRLLVADRGEHHLKLLDPEKGTGTSIGRRGDGPGEYRSIGWLLALGADSTLLTDDYARRHHVLSGGRVVRTRNADEPGYLLALTTPAGFDAFGRVLAIRAYAFVGGLVPDSIMVLLGNRATGEVATIARIRGPGAFGVAQTTGGRGGMVASNPWLAQDQVHLFRDGWLAVAYAGSYRVDWRTPRGEWIRGAPLPFAAVNISDREICRIREWGLWRAGRTVPPCDAEALRGYRDRHIWPDAVPPFPNLALMPAPDGRLLILRSPGAASENTRYDVVDRQGTLSGVISLPGNELIVGSSAKHLYISLTDESGLPRLRRHPWP